MERIWNRDKKTSMFRLTVVLLAVYSIFMYGILINQEERNRKLEATGDCHNWYAVVDGGSGNEDTEPVQELEPAQKLETVLHQNPGIDRVGLVSHGEYLCQEEPAAEWELFHYNPAALSLMQYSLCQGRFPVDSAEVVLTEAAQRAFRIGQKVVVEGQGYSHTVEVVGFLQGELLLDAQGIGNQDAGSQYAFLISSRYMRTLKSIRYGAFTVSEEPWREMERCPVRLIHCTDAAAFSQLEIELKQNGCFGFDLETAKELFSIRMKNLVGEDDFYIVCLLLVLYVFLVILEWKKKQFTWRKCLWKGVWLMAASLAMAVYEPVRLFCGGIQNDVFQIKWVLLIAAVNLMIYMVLSLLMRMYTSRHLT